MKRLMVVCVAYAVLVGCSKHDPTKEFECFAKQAASKARTLAKKTEVVNSGDDKGENVYIFSELKCEYDVVKCDSTVTPLTAFIVVRLPVVYMKSGSDDYRAFFANKFYFAYKNNNWEFRGDRYGEEKQIEPDDQAAMFYPSVNAYADLRGFFVP